MGEIRRYFDAKFGTGKSRFALARHRFRCDPDARGLSMDRRRNDARTFLFFRATRSDSFFAASRSPTRRSSCSCRGHRRQRVMARFDCDLPPATRQLQPLGFFLQSLQPARQARLRDGAHPVDKQNAVQMIDLMLQRAREQPGRLNPDLFSLERFRFHLARKPRDRCRQ